MVRMSLGRATEIQKRKCNEILTEILAGVVGIYTGESKRRVNRYQSPTQSSCGVDLDPIPDTLRVAVSQDT